MVGIMLDVDVEDPRMDEVAYEQPFVPFLIAVMGVQHEHVMVDMDVFMVDILVSLILVVMNGLNNKAILIFIIILGNRSTLGKLNVGWSPMNEVMAINSILVTRSFSIKTSKRIDGVVIINRIVSKTLLWSAIMDNPRLRIMGLVMDVIFSNKRGFGSEVINGDPHGYSVVVAILFL